MSSTNFLTKAPFWYTFTILVVLSLFIYGTHLNSAKVEFLQLNNEIDSLKVALSTRDTTLEKKNQIISEYTRQIAEIVRLKKVLQDSISNLKDSITTLQQTKPKVITRYEDHPVYIQRPEAYHQFGKGNGKLVIYNLCDNGNTKIWIDGVYEGTLDKYYTRDPGCAATSAIVKVSLAGKHHIQAQDGNGTNWDFYRILNEDNCAAIPLTCSK